MTPNATCAHCDLETDLKELLRQDRETYHRGSQTRAARRVLQSDPGVLAVMEVVLDILNPPALPESWQNAWDFPPLEV